MALTKTMLKEILSVAGVSAELAETAITKIMDGHLASVNALREERDAANEDVKKYKADSDALKSVQKELNDLKEKGDPDWQKKFEDEHAAFERFKSDLETKKVSEQKRKLYRDLLKECKVGKNQLDAVLKVTDVDSLELEDGKLKNVDKLKEAIAKDWDGFIMKTEKRRADVDVPPANNGGGNGEPESRAAQIAAKYHKELYG